MKDLKPIVTAISKNDDKAFRSFYDIYYDQVFHFSFYFLHDVEACKEVVSEVFFSVWQSRSKIVNIVNIETWLYVITKNEAIKYSKNAQRYSTVAIEDDFTITAHLQQQRDDATPEDIAIDKEIDELLTRVINTLPDKCKIIFLMARRDGLKNKEIAEILSIKESTVRVQLKIAIEKILEGIKPHFPNISFAFFLAILLGKDIF